MKVALIGVVAILLTLTFLALGSELYLRAFATEFRLPDDASPSVEMIVVLGAGTRPDLPLLSDRLYCATRAFHRWPKAQVLLTGNNVTTFEVTAMKDALQESAIPTSALILDGHGLNTRKSFHNLRSNFPNVSTIVICTNEFHQLRSVALARSYGFQAWAFGLDRQVYQSRFFLFFRERMSRVKFLLEHFLIQN